MSETIEPTHAAGLNKPLVIFLMGPTASGKTDLAIALRDYLPVELISVDSTLIYRGMDIGTAKPTLAEREQAPHRLIDIRDPSEPYSVADFITDVEREVADIHASGRIPLLVGGTMMYFRALIDGLAPMPPSDPAVREQIERDANEHGWDYVHRQLADVDPEIAAEIHPNHSQRVSRALEVFLVSGKTMSDFRKEQHHTNVQRFVDRYHVVQLAIAPFERSTLHQRIEKRFEQMIKNGLVDEVKALYDRGDLHPDLPAIRAVGYRQAWDYLAQKLTYEHMIERGIIATRQLAKRQFTWLRGWSTGTDSDLHWVITETDQGKSLSKEEIVRCALKFIAKSTI